MLTVKIKAATLEYHQQVEKAIVLKIKSTTSLKDYKELLEIFYGYFNPVEELIQPFIGNKLPDAEIRRKSKSILKDIKTINNAETGELAIKTPHIAIELPEIATELQAYGALYVLEGSTLGGKFISQMLRKQLQEDNDMLFSFFNGYGENSGAMWIKFQDALNSLPTNEDEETIIIESANQTFIKFGEWINKKTITS